MKSWVWTSLIVVGLHASAADAQLRVVVSDGELTSLGNLQFPREPSIDDNGAVAFFADDFDQATTVLARWSDGTFTKVAQLLDASPCGGTIDAFQEAPTPLRPQWGVLHTLEAGVPRSVGWNGSALTCLASFPSLAQRSAWPVTNLGGESLAGEAYPFVGGLYLVAPTGGVTTPVVGGGATVPTPPMATIQGTRAWALDDDGDVTALVVSTGGQDIGDYVVHGRPGTLSMLVPSGIGGNDAWTVRTFDVNRDGIVGYYAGVTPEADPLAGYNAIWLGAPGSETKVVQFPAMTTSGVEITHLVTSDRALHVVGGSHVVMHAEYGNIEGTAIVRWNSGTLEVIARSGTELRGHPGVMVHGFGGIGVDAAGVVYFTVFTNPTLTVSGVYRVAVGGDIEKLLAPGDTLQIQGVDETIDAAYFETSRGAGHGTVVSPTGKLVLAASYQGTTKQAIVTFDDTPRLPPDLALEIVEEEERRDSFDVDTENTIFEFVVFTVRITNVGEGAALPSSFVGTPVATMPRDPGFWSCGLLDDGPAEACPIPRLEPGASIEMQVSFLRYATEYQAELSVLVEDQTDANLTNNLISIEIPRRSVAANTCACHAPGQPPFGAALIVLSIVFVIRRRPRPAPGGSRR